MSTSTCQTCSSELTPISLRSAYTPPCCQSPICNRCISLNPRLKEYTPCLRCGDPKRAELKGAVTISDRCILPTSRRVERQVASASGGEHQVVFAIGDDEEDDGDLPPAYELTGSTDEHMCSTAPAAEYPSSNGPSSSDESRDTPIEDNGSIAEPEPESEVVEVRHSLKRGETLLAIARKYAADPHEILILNNLPHTVLTSHPHLLRTRSSLLISRRSIPRSNLASIPNMSAASGEGRTEADDKRREEERERERQVKRFQLLTKNVDPGVGKAYLALEEMTESQHPLEYSSGEQLALSPESTGTGKKGLLSESGNGGRENRALERYWQDEEWERDHGGPPPSDQYKYKKGGLSKLGSASNRNKQQSHDEGNGQGSSTSTTISSWMGIPIKS